MRVFLLLTLLVLVFPAVHAQEVLVPPGMNAVLQNDFPDVSVRNKSVDMKLPFYEDFSAFSVYPDVNRFSDSTVFINNGFAIDPVTTGVATFDGLDAHGYLYEHGSSFTFPADTLTSRAIEMDSVLSGTPHVTTPADSLYFSFYYQPQGNGEKPDTEDSLLLEFYAANQNTWNQVWSVGGMSYTAFLTENGSPWKCVMVPITDTAYMNDGFRFRFRNYASYADMSFPTWVSNADFWNIDYIYIDSDRDSTDTVPSDLAFRNRKETLLKDYFHMPWNQFIANPSAEMASTLQMPYSNYSATLLNVTERLLIADLSGTSAGYNSGLSASNLAPGTDTSFYRNPIPYTYTSGVTQNAEFEVKLAINTATISDPIVTNDTLAFYQRFYNFYAMDDGTAEGGYGLTIDGGKCALKFTVNTPDTLRSVDLFFNRTVNDANQIYFYLTIWNDNGGKPGTILYQQAGVRPEFEDGFYNFHTYVLDEPLAVSGSFYVGWEQTTDEVLNLGFDKNNNQSDRFFYNTDGNWYNSLYEGTPMIRIIVGDSIEHHVGMEESDLKTIVFPNPCNNCNEVSVTGSDVEKITLLDVNGRIIRQEFNSTTLNTTGLDPGFYTLVVEQSGAQPVFVKWILTR